MRKERFDREQEVLDTVVLLLTEVGFNQLTTDAVAARVRVSKQTIYRRWPSKAKLVVAAVRSMAETGAESPDTGSLHDDLVALLKEVRVKFLDNDHLSIPALLSASRRTDEELDNALIDLSIERRRPFLALFERARERGEITAEADIDALTDSIVGAVFMRYLFRRVTVDDAAITAIVETVLYGPAVIGKKP